MTSPTPDHWQIQDAKQRFSEMIRAVLSEGPQVITRHGEDVAVVVNIGEYGPCDSTRIPLGSDAACTRRTARTRQWIVRANAGWNVQYSRSSATLVSLVK